ncbi:MAG: GntR family transcriptional regulator [Quisquiliibacterium sp.]|jgi:DNA-binding GntR family transcriptional regulator
MKAETFDRSTDMEIDEESIVERVFDAVLEGRLPPGTKLAESALCAAFGVGRMRIRRSLLILASREVIELQANKGAFVASPTPGQAREVFEARLAIEPTIARLAAERATGADIELLRENLERELSAHRDNLRHEAIRLSGEFHLLLAQIAGNTVLQRISKELVTRTSLIIGLFGGPGVTNCRDDDHAAIVDAFSDKDASKAEHMMRKHLGHIESHLDLKRGAVSPINLAGLFVKSSSAI